MTEEEKVSTEAEAEKKVYEVGFHIVPSVPQEESGTIFSAVKTAIEKKGGTIISEGTPSMIPLSYTMEKAKAGKYTKYNQAYFGFIKFEIEPENVPELESYFKNLEEILRYIIVKTVKENTMFVPKVSTYSKQKNSAGIPVSESTETEGEEKVEVSDSEIDKALDEAISE